MLARCWCWWRLPLGRRHYLNPSNFGIAVTLLLFPWVGIAAYDSRRTWAPATGRFRWSSCTGSFLNTGTPRIPLVLAWVGIFALQAIVSSLILWSSTGYCPILARLSAMTGVAFIVFTFYMVTDPATTPERPWAQVAFGALVALVFARTLYSRSDASTASVQTWRLFLSVRAVGCFRSRQPQVRKTEAVFCRAALRVQRLFRRST